MTNERILFACKIEDPDARSRVATLGQLDEDPTLDSPEKLIKAVADATVLIVPFTEQLLITKEVIDAHPSLRLVGTTYGGLRQNVDDIYAVSKGLCVIHTGPTRIRPMAEYTLTLILSALTRIPNYHHAMCSGDVWPRENFGRTRILHDRKVGIIGFGLIGQGIASLVKHFTDKVLIHSEHASPETLRLQGFKKASLAEIFSSCEVIVLAGGYTPKTHHMIRKEHFEVMAEEAVFVNIARGKMVCEAEMTAVVQTKNILLALDVFEEEPLAADSPLRRSERVILAPHRANAPREFELRWQFLADELERFYQGKKPETALSLERASVMSES